MRLLAFALVLTGCGRFGFGESEPGVDTSVDANPLDAICGPLDTDGDGVGDACDPSNAAAHQVLLFESFTTMPAGWTTTGAAQWSITSDGLHGVYTDISASSFVAPMTFAPPLTLRIDYTIDGLDPGSSNFTISAVDAFDIPTQDSQKCGQASPSRNAIGHEMAGTTVDASSVQFDDSLVIGASYITTFDHGIANMTCTTQVPAIGASVGVEHAPWRANGQVGVRIRSIAATFHSLLVVAPQ